MTSLELSNLREKIRGLPINCDERKYAAIILIVTDVENATLIHLSDDERNTLAKELYNLNEPIEKTIRRAEQVKHSEHYGRIGIDLWIKTIYVPIDYSPKKYKCECGKELFTSERYRHDETCEHHKPADIKVVEKIVKKFKQQFKEK